MKRQVIYTLIANFYQNIFKNHIYQQKLHNHGRRSLTFLRERRTQDARSIESSKAKVIRPDHFGSLLINLVVLVSIALFVGLRPASVAAEPFAYVTSKFSNRIIVVAPNEKVEFSFRLSAYSQVDGVLKKMNLGECEASFDVISIGIDGTPLESTPVSVGVGEVWIDTQFESTLNKDQSGNVVSATYILAFVDYKSIGPCKPQFHARVVGPLGSTRAVIPTDILP